LTDSLNKVVGDVFVSAASIAYYGPFTGVYRNDIVKEWLSYCKDLGVPTSEKYSL